MTDWDTYAYDLGAHSHAARVIVMPASVFDSFSYLVCVDLSSVSVCVCARARANYLHVGLADSLSSLSFSLYTRGGMT